MSRESGDSKVRLCFHRIRGWWVLGHDGSMGSRPWLPAAAAFAAISTAKPWQQVAPQR